MLRSLAVAGVLTLTCVFGSATAVAPALADPGESDGSSQNSNDPGDSGGSGDGSEDPGGDEPAPNEPEAPADAEDPSEVAPAEEPQQPEAPRGSEPEPDDSGAEPAQSGRDEPAFEPPPPPPAIAEHENSIRLPWFRLPAAGEIPPGTWPTASTFYTTVVIPVPTLAEFLQALRVVPAPAPAPGPAFRTQQEAPPVADASTGTATGGGGGGGGGVMSEPVVFRAPLVTVPRSTTIAGKPSKLPPGVGPTVPSGVTQPGMAGVRTPAIRGSLPPTPGATAPPQVTPAGGQAPRVGALARGVTNPTLAEIAAVALPGVAGLLFLTFGGGMIGYRQANSARFVRTAGAERFLP